MKLRGISADILSSPGSLLDEFATHEGIRAFAVDMPRRISLLKDIVAIGRILNVLSQVHPDIVHAHTPKGGLLGMIAAWLARVPVRIYHMHGLPYETSKGYRRLLLSWSERISCALAHQVLCVSPSLRDKAIKLQLAAPEKLRVLGKGTINGIDATSLFNPIQITEVREIVRVQLGIPASAVVIGFVGRLVRDKGIIELAEAWSAIRDAVPQAHMLIVGEAEPRDPVPEEILSNLQADARVHWVGFVADLGDMPPYYQAMDLLALPTYREGFPNVPMEAAAMGLPVVVSRVTGCVDAVVDGTTGTLVPVKDSTSLAQAMLRYINDPSLRASHGAAGRKRILCDFQPEQCWQATHNLYVELLEKHRV